jgi:hypothetical protein
MEALVRQSHIMCDALCSEALADLKHNFVSGRYDEANLIPHLTYSSSILDKLPSLTAPRGALVKSVGKLITHLLELIRGKRETYGDPGGEVDKGTN